MQHKLLPRHPLGNPRRIWRQDNFILSTFSPAATNYKPDPDAEQKTRRAVRTCAEAGFNLLELGWATEAISAAAVPMAEQMGIDIIYQNMEVCGGMQAKKGIRCAESDLRAVVDQLRPWRHVAGYYVWDEPYLPEQLTEARRQMDIFQQYDPTALLFSVAIPSYNKVYRWENGEFAGYLRRYAEIVDPVVLSLDYYPVGMREHDTTRQLDASKMWCDLGLMRKIAAEFDMPMWFYYQGQNLHNVDFFIFPMVRLMMYAGALYGAKGLQHYTAWDSVVGLDGGHGQFFAEQKQIHAEFRQLGNTLMALTCRRVFHDAALLPGCPYLTGLADDIADSELLGAPLPYRVSAAEFDDDYGNRYLMVLNRDYLTAKTVILPLKAPSRVYLVSREDGMQHVVADTTAALTVTLAAGDAMLYRLQPAEEEAFTVEYKIEK